MVTHQHNNYRINSYAAILLDLLVSALSANPGRFKTWGGTLRSCGVVDGDSMVGANHSSSQPGWNATQRTFRTFPLILTGSFYPYLLSLAPLLTLLQSTANSAFTFRLLQFSQGHFLSPFLCSIVRRWDSSVFEGVDRVVALNFVILYADQQGQQTVHG